MKVFMTLLVLGLGVNRGAAFAPSASFSRRDMVQARLSPTEEQKGGVFKDIQVADWFGISCDEYDEVKHHSPNQIRGSQSEDAQQSELERMIEDYESPNDMWDDYLAYGL